MPHDYPCRIIGVLDNGLHGLAPQALEHLRRADLVIAGTRVLALFAGELAPDSETRDLTGKLSQIPDWIREAQAKGLRVVVLATGDPLCHGIAGFLQSRLCIENFEILPNLSMVQLACARLGIPWQDMKILSVHGPDTGEWPNKRQWGAGPEHGLYSILQAVARHDRLAIYTSPHNSPDRIARMLVEEGFADDFQLAVAERLLRDDERVVTDCTVREAARRHFADPNILLLWRNTPRPREPLFGLPDEDYRQRQPDKGLITGREVRAVSLARLQLAGDSIVWDIGAGSGAVGLEAARLCPDGHVFAIEKNAEDYANCVENRRQLRVTNYTPRHGKAPKGLDDWPDPDAVFIGGSGGELVVLIRLTLERLKLGGRLVMNFVTFENLSTAIGILKEIGATWDVTQLNVSRSRPILDMHRLAAENPVWIVCASRSGES
ncbi:MAG: precorrin-6Y C5,15-methyltransferase (decarboxylating) [Candidatus Kentron sp. G]|nr:MAG: precorrin-6Y C5,15-methyltransferase (decarboxylating) [Candidatus Kentron sp. G]VFM97301.1 MAG: precorrin-6Y C5,15-methyltransferase (decarboxylating) [Candidatus Kentron sp. G]VFM99529.1 MAG: precorrin-6Y C5,15-methyltransferase (decarboxylating) [Candidatus Kentron sp. G]